MPVPKYILACIFSFLTISLFAQSTIAERLEEMIYNTQDFEESVKVYQSITPLDIEQMEDSVLFDYYYLGGYINRELKTILRLLNICQKQGNCVKQNSVLTRYNIWIQ